jgi:plasmid stabilization system protein ParE
MTRVLDLTRKANRDMDETMEWLRMGYTARAAARWQIAIGKALLEVQTNPERYSECENMSISGVDLREKLVRRYRGVVYRILYSFDENAVTIHRVRNASQDSLGEDNF